MRVLFVVWGWPSHFFAMVPTAWACWSAGHEVLVATQPVLQPTLRETGLPAASVGTDLNTAAMFRERMAPAKDDEGRLSRLSAPDAPRPAEPAADPRMLILEVYGALARAMTDDTVRVARRWGADVVVWDPITFAGAIAARACGAVSVRHTWGLDSARFMGLYDAWPPDLHELLAEYDVPFERIREDLCLDICPPRLQIPPAGRTVTARSVPYNGADVGVIRMLPPPRLPRVCVTWGTTVEQLAGQGQFPAGAVLCDLAARDVEVVVAASDAQIAELGTLPKNVVASGWLPLRSVLESCTAIVHEGGAGTVLTASRLGVPQLVIPALHEQILAGEQLAAAGAGQHLPAGEVTEESLAECLSALLRDDEHRAAAEDLRQHILAQPSLAEIVSRWGDDLAS